jgi:hypothetical protein
VLLEDSTLRKFGVYFFLNSATEGERDTKNFIRVPSPSTAFVKVRSASLGIRFLITRHSPTKILQTGLLGAPERNPTGTRRVRRSQSVLSGPVSEANNAKYWHISRVSQLSKDDFLCNPDCVAEGGGFEPSIQVLARNTHLANALLCMASGVVAAVALFA